MSSVPTGGGHYGRQGTLFIQRGLPALSTEPRALSTELSSDIRTTKKLEIALSFLHCATHTGTCLPPPTKNHEEMSALPRHVTQRKHCHGSFVTATEAENIQGGENFWSALQVLEHKTPWIERRTFFPKTTHSAKVSFFNWFMNL